MRLRWLRLVVDEGHELGQPDPTEDELRANRFIGELPAERRWIMSGTPTTGAPAETRAPQSPGPARAACCSGARPPSRAAAGSSVAGEGGALSQLERLMRFLREPSYGVADERGQLGARWAREVAGPVAKLQAGARERLSAREENPRRASCSRRVL
jgi:hypothetical protein